MIAAATKTFVHGDFRIENMSFDPTDGGDPVLSDWQLKGGPQGPGHCVAGAEWRVLQWPALPSW